MNMSYIEKEFQQLEKQRGWSTLFEKLDKDHRQKFSEKKMDIASLTINQHFNRFSDVLPFDDTRVRLRRGSNDYINANYVQVPSANRKYIVTQGPLSSTISHFWQMIWEENSRVIIMLTQLIEKGSSKCCLYYPDNPNQSELIFQDIDLKLTYLSERPYRYYTQRKFHLTNLLTDESRLIIHWADFDWPDHGAPSSPMPFLQLLNDVRRCGAFDSRLGAPIVHCSAGIGRSGTFVLVDSILKLLAHSNSSGEISLIDILIDLRSQRYGLIQTVDQLRFSYVAIIAGFKILDELEESERVYLECDVHQSSDDDDDDRIHPKICKRQDNIMPNGRLSELFEDINCDLMQRIDSTAGSSQFSPKMTRRLISISTDENVQRTVNEIQSRLNDQSLVFSPVKNDVSFLHYLTRKYRRSFLFAMITFITGSVLLYKYISNNSRQS